MFSSFSIEHAEPKAKYEARRSLCATLVISFLPLVLGFLVATSGDNEFWAAFIKVFLSGQLYFYAISLCASIYTIGQLSNHESNLSMRLWSGLFVLCCAAFMALYVGQSGLANDAYFSLAHSGASVVFLFVAIWLNYRVMVLVNQPPPTPEQVNRSRALAVTNAVDPQYDE